MILVQDNILKEEQIEAARQSAITAGFGNWTPLLHTFTDYN